MIPRKKETRHVRRLLRLVITSSVEVSWCQMILVLSTWTLPTVSHLLLVSLTLQDKRTEHQGGECSVLFEPPELIYRKTVYQFLLSTLAK